MSEEKQTSLRGKEGQTSGQANQKRSDEDFESMLQDYESSRKGFSEGEVLKGTVLKVTENEVIVDIGYKSEGIIPIAEFMMEGGKIQVKPGDQVDVLLEQAEDVEGYIVLSREKAEKMKVWDQIERAYNDRSTVTGRIIERIKGGFAVDIGVRAFLPGSQLDIKPVRNIDALRGKDLLMRVIKVNKKRGNIVLSRKAVLEEEAESRKKVTLENLHEGALLRGYVKNITDYGAFIDLGGIDGLLHITDMSWGRINHPSEIFQPGDEVDVVVLKFDRETERVSLGYKQRQRDPWETVTEKFPVGSRVRGKVISLTEYGAFVSIEDGVEGLIHVSEMSWNKRVKHPSRILSVGDVVVTQVLGIDQANRRISLGLKQTEPNPWQVLGEKYQIGSVIKGKIRNLTEFGAFVEVEDGIDGLIHVSDLSWTKKIKHPSEVLKKGEVVEAMILNIDSGNQRLSLGIKQLQPDVWEEFVKNHGVGDVLPAKVVRVTNFGVFVELEPGIEGLIHVSELDDKRVEKPEDKFKPGDPVTAKIIKINNAEKKIGLSIRAAILDRERADVAEYQASTGTAGKTSLGDYLREATEQMSSLRQQKE
ncbi:MAG: 30S ribosomal protein S1 [Acidobacteriota bacterium]